MGSEAMRPRTVRIKALFAKLGSWKYAPHSKTHRTHRPI